MKNLLSLIYIGLFLGVGASTAAPIPIRSGEHEGYTRLVLTLPSEQTEWHIETEVNSAKLTVTGADAGFSVEDIFERISRDRLASVHTKDGSDALTLVLGCACGVKAFRFGANYLVLDISSDFAQEAPTEIEVKADASQLREKRQPLTFGANGGEIDVASLQLSLGSNPTPQSQSHDVETSVATTLTTIEKASDTVADVLPLKDYLNSRQNLRTAQSDLLKQLGRAASLGLLEPKGKVPVSSPAEMVVKDEQGVEPQMGSSEATTIEHLNLRAQNSVERELAETLGSFSNVASVNGGCQPSFSIRHWGDETSVDQQIATRRAHLVNELGIVDPERARDLAKLYIYFGFGAEARQAMTFAPETSPRERAFFRALADIMDFGKLTGPNPFHKLYNCDTEIAMWSLLAARVENVQPDIKTKAITRSFSALPLHLRHHLGPKLSDQFLALGDQKTSRMILKLIKRGEQETDAHFAMAAAEIELAEGNVTKAQAGLQDVVMAENELSPKALIKLIDVHLAENQPISSSTAELVSALVLEHRDTAFGPELRRVHALARAQAHQFGSAFDALRDMRDRDDGAIINQTRSVVTNILTAQADDYQFVENLLLNIIDPHATVSFESEHLAAKRLLELGFPDLALSLLAAEPEETLVEERRMLRAQAALLQRKPLQAEAEVMALAGANVDRLRADARTLAGDFGVAAKLFQSVQAHDKAENAAWLAGDWETLEHSESDVYRRVVNLTKDAEMVHVSEDIPDNLIAKERVLLQKSQSVRATLVDLLAMHSVDAMPTE